MIIVTKLLQRKQNWYMIAIIRKHSQGISENYIKVKFPARILRAIWENDADSAS